MVGEGLVLAKEVRNATHHLQILWFRLYSSPSTKITSPGHTAGCWFGRAQGIKTRTPAGPQLTFDL